MNNIPLHGYTAFFGHLSVYGHLRCFLHLPTVNSAIMNMDVQIPLQDPSGTSFGNFSLWSSRNKYD